MSKKRRRINDNVPKFGLHLLFYLFQTKGNNIKLHTLGKSKNFDGRLKISEIFNFWKKDKGNK